MSSPDSTSRVDAFAALRVPRIASLVLGRALAMLALQFISVAVGWDLYERTGDPWMLGLVGLVQIIPALALTLPAGVVVDRYRRRDIALISYVALSVATFGLTIVSWLNAPVWLVFVMLAVCGAARPFAFPSVNAIPPEILQPRDLSNAYSWMVSSNQVASIGGPALAGLLIALTNEAGSSYLLAAIAELLFVIILLRMPRGHPPHTDRRQTLRDIFAGVSFIRRNEVYLAAITLDLFAVLLGGAIALLPVYAKEVLAVGPAGLGLLRSAPAVGALLAALVTTRLPPWQRPGRVLLVVVAIFGISTVGFGVSQDMTLSLLCLFIGGAADSVSMVIRGTLEQVTTPNHLRGRVSAVNSLFIGLSNELGAFRSGAVAAMLGPVVSVVGGGIGTLIVVTAVGLGWRSLSRIGPLHTLKPLEDDPRPAVVPEE
ncbi:MAG TPA: MFS transporter, partial [Chloroflexota bacterium]|nr:MFS transporter [Chloroflexota bacterium]